MIYTGTNLSPEQIEKVKEAMNAPVMYLSGGTPMFERPEQLVHRFALANGLPEIPGYYGADLRDGKIYRSQP